ncbi:zinc-binding dehydrogenase [Paenibacillus sacheonensis]|uniref:Zinc-binding dehydrogenase n=1 Tax=Paenibacillus sacheonensis TaxID=742054 RepID=A0A7X4YJS7_9BACL|nr:2-desacetyl-2-hydroxyethyl bacteriochlorophyllide A dehydrogenase [Paenibacillus sacheonensis]NBC67572.1 zinc-binding dehydrogenase [Paenibacillus sacheonensis]
MGAIVTKTDAVLFYGRHDARLGSIEIGDPGPDEVQVRTSASLISTGTERWILTDRFSASGTPYPCVPGYQRVGIVTKTGSNVRDVRIGERVIATSGSWTGGSIPYWGAHLALANTSRSEIYPVADSLSNEDAAGIVVAQVGYNAASRVSLGGDDWIVVYGDGLIGQCAAQAARARGAKTILVGRRRERLELGAIYSADHVIDSSAGDLSGQVKEITGGRHATAVLDTLQQRELQLEYVPLLEQGAGQIVYCGHAIGDAWADMSLLQACGLTCHFVSDWTRERNEAALSLLTEGSMRLAPLVTHRGTAAEAPGFYRMLLDKKEPFLGILIDWSLEQ